MAMFYPRKQTLIIFILCLIAVGATGYSAWNGSTSSDETARAKAPADKAAAPEQTIVTGTDWQKQFLEKGTSTAFRAASSSPAVASSGPLTATDILGKEFLIKLAEIQQSGQAKDPQAINDVAAQLVEESLAAVQPPDPFTDADIQTAAVTDAASLRAYADLLRLTLNTYMPDVDHNEAVIAMKALDKDDMSILKNIDPVIKNYRSAVAALRSMKVPKPVAEYHLALLNGLNLTLFNAQSLRNIDTDPLKGMAAINMEMAGLEAMDKAMTSIKDYFSDAGVPFSG